MLKYLNRTTEMRLNLSVEDLLVTKWYVDAAHAVHEDCKSHSGDALTHGKGMVTLMSHNQKLNGKSSTESELIGFHAMVHPALQFCCILVSEKLQ